LAQSAVLQRVKCEEHIRPQ